MANMGGQLPIDVQLDGEPLETHSTYTAAAGGTVLTITTVLPDHGLAFELISVYVGHAGVFTQVTHLALGPVGHPPSIEQLELDEQPGPSVDPRGCAYDHAHQLVEQLTALGYRPGVRVDERTFIALERVE